jgi:hypothetical protein
MDDDEIRRRLEEIFGPPPRPQRLALTSRTLDDILASRTHVRVLRVLVAEGRRTNLTGRDLARRAKASHGRVLQVLRQLCSSGLVRAYHDSTYSLYYLDEEHPLTRAIRFLFDEERRIGEAATAESGA